jgi:hypothetical protein
VIRIAGNGHPWGMVVRSAAEVVHRWGTSYAADAGIRLRDTPAPLYQLCVLATVLARPVAAATGVAACRELRRAGGTTAVRMAALTWQQRVDALGRAHYRRLDESTATILGEAAEHLRTEYRGDLRRLADRAERDVGRATELLTGIPGIGPTGADIFLREVQGIWSWVGFRIDRKVLDGAEILGLPTDRGRLRKWAGNADPVAVGAALVRIALDPSSVGEPDEG